MNFNLAGKDRHVQNWMRTTFLRPVRNGMWIQCEIVESEDGELSGAGGSNKDQPEDDIAPPTGGFGYTPKIITWLKKQSHQRTRRVSPSQKFQHWMEGRPSSHSKKLMNS